MFYFTKKKIEAESHTFIPGWSEMHYTYVAQAGFKLIVILSALGFLVLELQAWAPTPGFHVALEPPSHRCSSYVQVCTLL